MKEEGEQYMEQGSEEALPEGKVRKQGRETGWKTSYSEGIRNAEKIRTFI